MTLQYDVHGANGKEEKRFKCVKRFLFRPFRVQRGAYAVTTRILIQLYHARPCRLYSWLHALFLSDQIQTEGSVGTAICAELAPEYLAFLLVSTPILSPHAERTLSSPPVS